VAIVVLCWYLFILVLVTPHAFIPQIPMPFPSVGLEGPIFVLAWALYALYWQRVGGMLAFAFMHPGFLKFNIRWVLRLAAVVTAGDVAGYVFSANGIAAWYVGAILMACLVWLFSYFEIPVPTRKTEDTSSPIIRGTYINTFAQAKQNADSLRKEQEKTK
jgi:hypothetical protein